MLAVVLIVEGVTDFPVARKLLKMAGMKSARSIAMGGKSKLDARLGGYNHAADHMPRIVLRDLDNDSTCAGEFAARLLPSPAEFMCHRLVVRSMEAWLMGDPVGLGTYLHVSPGKIPLAPELETNPKQCLVNLARSSTKPALVQDMVPSPSGLRPTGPRFTAHVAAFAKDSWRPEVARLACPSLDRAIKAIERLGARWLERHGPRRSSRPFAPGAPLERKVAPAAPRPGGLSG